MAKRTLTNPQGVPEIYGRRQPKRPHYLRDWVERRGFKTDAAFAKEIDADKGVVSRWLDENNPTTPGKEWQLRLGVFFGDADDPVDIFRHPDDDWFARLVRTNSLEQVERAKQILEAAGIAPEPHKKTSKRSY